MRRALQRLGRAYLVPGCFSRGPAHAPHQMAMTKIAQLLRQNAIPQTLASGALQNLLVRLGADSAEDPRVAEYLA